MKRLFCLGFVFIWIQAHTQINYKDLGMVYQLSSRYNMFPDSLRNIDPRIYKGTVYSAQNHYNDSSLWVFIPKYFKKKKPYTQVIYMHGWYNNIDSAVQQFKLIEQFCLSKINGILILPEGPKNAPDSYAGKFEQANVFTLFLNDVTKQLQQLHLVPINAKSSLCLAGHSGAYKAIAKIVEKNNLYNQVNSIFLFDALYGEATTFTKFVTENSKAKLFCVYTNNGGTLTNCENFLGNLKIGYLKKIETACTSKDLQENNIVFLHSALTHNEVVHSYNNFARFLKALH